ncbi:enhancer of mRNA-decapping protein 4 [Ostrinia furnacalis]|uniref:enhancer of mRNA-decapping protein 4 n=1 Tax=Ostrinia furnacalis TaxID=93504 RepID=UPI00103BF3C3|nr:enhancer of mRNA-decapping protein 4 [Ostrinia furnacalis]
MQPATMLPKLTETTQTISFSEGDGVCSAEVFANQVVVTTNAGNHNHGSSKVKLKNLVDYNWEPKFYPGQLLAIHLSGKYLAYSIKAPNAVNPGTWSGMVRVVYNTEPGIDRRALIKGMKGEVQDLSFAHIQKEVVLACIDEHGNFYVHEIEATDSGLRCTLIAEVREETGSLGAWHRVVWCPYIPDDDDDAPSDDVARLLLTTHNNIARMWNIRAAATGSGAAGACGGAVWGGEHSAPLVDAAFSPDGTALATASADGYVMFFQVYMHNESSPRCLHKWQPHAGKPLSCLFFLDNHKNYNSDVQFWKFAVTGAENNTSIKIWSCKSWNCLQSISFTTGPSAEPASLGLKAMLDSSASYLILSDFKARSLYVLNMARDAEDSTAYCRSISEFLLPYPVLSFCIVDAEEEQAKCESSCDDPFHRNGSGDDAPAEPDDFDLQGHESPGAECGESGRRVRVRLYIVQPKGLQEGELVYAQPSPRTHGLSDLALEPPAACEAPGIASSILQQQSQQLKSLLMSKQTQPGSLIGQRPESPVITPQLNLMTPDAFSSPGKREEDDPPLSATPDVTGVSRTSTGGLVVSDSVSGGTSASGGSGALGGAKLASAGSSPSREVQEIMAHGDYYPPMQENDDVEEDTEPEAPITVITPTTEPANAPANASSTVNVAALTNAANLANVANLTNAANMANVANLTNAANIANVASLTNAANLANVASLTNAANLANVANLPAALAGAARSELFVPPEKPPPPGKLVHSNSDTSWPQISLAQISEANQRKASSDKSSSQSLNASLLTANDRERDRDRDTPAERARLDALDLKLDKLTELVSAQSRELRALRGAVASPREAVDAALHAHAARTTAAIHEALSEGWERIARVGEAASGRAAQAAGLGAARALEPLAAALQHELAAKLSATDHLLRDNIDKLANSKTMMERLSTSIAKSLSDMVRESFRETLFECVVPAMEKAHAQLFRQINGAFQNGTKEFAANTEAAARAAAERGGAAATASLRAALDRHAAALAAAAANHPSPHHYAPALQEAAHSVLEKEMVWWREQARSLALQVSRAHSPATPAASHASSMDRQMQVAQIQSLMSSGDMNGAFQLALSASDLALVMSACRAAEPARVFGPPCQLKQHVLLSLVQQLAADMSRDTALKHRYLEEAIMNLDTSNPVTREHLPVVVRELQKQVCAFLSAQPSHALARQFKMLLMAADSLVKAA